MEDVYYKLKQIDIDGKFTFSNIVRLSSNDNNASFKIYPNPVTNNFTASFSASKSGVATLLIRNTNGQTVYRKSVSVIKGANSVSITGQQLSIRYVLYYCYE